VEHNFFTFRTGMFRSDQPDDELDRWFLGEDCAKWLYTQLLAVQGVSPSVAPLEEDWGGWTFRIRVLTDRFWINVWYGLETPDAWTVDIEPTFSPWRVFRKKAAGRARARLLDAVNSVLASASEVSHVQWHETHPHRGS
jgi:hypothetical protein